MLCSIQQQSLDNSPDNINQQQRSQLNYYSHISRHFRQGSANCYFFIFSFDSFFFFFLHTRFLKIKTEEWSCFFCLLFFLVFIAKVECNRENVPLQTQYWRLIGFRGMNFRPLGTHTSVFLGFWKYIAWLSLPRVQLFISMTVKMYKYLKSKHTSAATKARHIFKNKFMSFNRILHHHISQKHCNKMNQKCIACGTDKRQVEDKDIMYQKDTLNGR